MKRTEMRASVVVGPEHKRLLAQAVSCTDWDNGSRGSDEMSSFVYAAVQHYVPSAEYGGDRCYFEGTVADFRQLLEEALVKIGPITLTCGAWENRWVVQDSETPAE